MSRTFIKAFRVKRLITTIVAAIVIFSLVLAVFAWAVKYCGHSSSPKLSPEKEKIIKTFQEQAPRDIKEP